MVDAPHQGRGPRRCRQHGGWGEPASRLFREHGLGSAPVRQRAWRSGAFELCVTSTLPWSCPAPVLFRYSCAHRPVVLRWGGEAGQTAPRQAKPCLSFPGLPVPWRVTESMQGPMEPYSAGWCGAQKCMAPRPLGDSEEGWVLLGRAVSQGLEAEIGTQGRRSIAPGEEMTPRWSRLEGEGWLLGWPPEHLKCRPSRHLQTGIPGLRCRSGEKSCHPDVGPPQTASRILSQGESQNCQVPPRPQDGKCQALPGTHAQACLSAGTTF